MDAPNRSPILGYNHNISYRGRVYHVQTEDSGPATHRVFTHLFFGGTILASKKVEYDPFSPEDVVKAIMQGQHKAVLRELKNAQYNDKIEVFFTAVGQVAFLEDAEPAAAAKPAAAAPAAAAPAAVPPAATAPAAPAAPMAAAAPAAPAPADVPAPHPPAAPAYKAVAMRPSALAPERHAAERQVATVAGVIEVPAVPAGSRASMRPIDTPPPMVVELQPPAGASTSRPAVLPLDGEPATPALDPPSMPPLPATIVPTPGAVPVGRRTPAEQRQRTPPAGIPVTVGMPRPPGARRTSMPGAQPTRMQPENAVPVARSPQQQGSGLVIVQRNVVIGASSPPTGANAHPRPKLNYPTAGAQRPASSYRSGAAGQRSGGTGQAPAPRRALDVQFSFPSERNPASPEEPRGEQEKGMDDIILEYLSEDQSPSTPEGDKPEGDK